MMKLLVVIFVSLCQIFSSYNALLFTRYNLIFRTKIFAKPSHQVTIQHEGTETVLQVPEDVSILSAALDAGIELPYDCKLGVCLTCPSRIVSGIVDQSEGTLEESVASQGFALTCVSYPRSAVVIKSIEEDELVSAQFTREDQ
jgi:ferredoxin